MYVHHRDINKKSERKRREKAAKQTAKEGPFVVSTVKKNYIYIKKITTSMHDKK